MSIISLYSKIQLKIGKYREQKISFSVDRNLRSLWTRNKFSCSLHFWKTAKIIVRFFALLFNDSSENYLIFTRFNKDSVVVCNNSFCQYRRFQKRVRFYSKTAFVGILISTIITSSILYFMMPGKPSSYAVTYTWDQTDWSGVANTTTFPVHLTNQTGWTDYYAKDANVDVTTIGEAKLSQTSSSWIETTNTDFDGTLTDVQVSGNDLILLPPTATITTTFSAGDTDADEAGASNVNFDTAGGVVKLADYSWLSGYLYRKPITLTGQTGAGTNYQIKLLVGQSSGSTGDNFDLEGKYIDFPTDLRFTDSDTVTLLDYWVENVTGPAFFQVATIYIEVADSLESNADIYIYYDKPLDASNSSGVNTFSFFDDFSGAAKWTGVGTYGTTGEGYSSASQTGTGTSTSTLTSNIIGTGIFKATLNFKSSGSSETGCSYVHNLYQRTTTDTLLDSTAYADYTSKSYDISGTDVKLKLYSSATGSSAESCNHGGDVDTLMCCGDEFGCDECIGINQTGCEYCGGTWAIESNTASASVYVDDVFVRKYVNPEPAFSSAGSEEGLPISGAFTSTNLLDAQTVGPIDSFTYNLTVLPAGTTAKVSFSQDNINWFNSAGTADGWDTMDTISGKTISLTALNWTGTNFYYKMEWTSDGSDTPILDSVSVHTNYPSTGNLISSIKDTGIADPDFTTITWNETLNTYGDVNLKVRSSDNADMSGATAWGSIAVIESSGADISGIGSGQYVQYQTILSTTDQTVTPQLHDVAINWGVTSTFISSPYNTEAVENIFNKILWTENGLANTDIKFQLRTSADNVTWTNWCGPDNGEAGCDTATYFTDPIGGETVDADFTDGTGDQWIQYKVWLSSTSANNPVLSDVTLQYVINTPPTVSVSSVSQGADGIVSISYTIADEDSSSATVSFLADVGVALNEALTSDDTTAITVTNIDRLPASGTIQIDNEQISYTLKSGNDLDGTTGIIIRGANNTKAVVHSSGAVIWVKGTTANISGDVGSITGITSTPTSKSGTWTIKTDLDELYYATAKIRVSANDGNAANQVGSGDSTAFAIDTKNPIYGSPPLVIDSNASGDLLTNIAVTEDSTLSVRFVDASSIDGSTCTADIASVAYESLVGNSKAWMLNPDANGVSTVCFQAKDDYGNVSSVTFASTPQTVTDSQVNDISFPPSSKFKLLVWWGVVPDPGSFSQYNIYRSTDGSSYSLYTTISDRLINYCFDEGDGNCNDDNLGGLNSATTYYYKITAQDVDGISTYSSVVSAVPDGSTSGEVDATAPILSSGPSDSVSSSTATITWITNEGSYSLVRYGTTTSLGSVAGSSTETVTSHSVDILDLTPGVLYYYQILSADSSGNLLSSPASPPTGLHTFTTTADNTAPAISSGPIVTAGRDSATILWVTDEASDSQVKYIVAVDNTTDPAGVGGIATTLQTEKVTNHFVIIMGLSSDTTYNYQIISTDNYTNTLTSPSSAPFVQFTTSTDKADSDAPVITFNSIDDVTEGLDSAVIVWTTDENAYSVVEYGLTESLGSVAGTVDNSTTNHSVTVSNLSNNKAYYYKLHSADSSGNLATKPDTGTNTFTTTADTIDPVILSVTVASSDRSSAVITWNTDETASSQVEYGINADLSGSSLTTLQSEKISNHITVLTGLTPDISYYYRVISADTAGNSAQSSIGSFETISGAKPVVIFNETTQGPSLANFSLGDHTASVAFSASSNAFFSVVYEASATEPGSYTQEYGVPSLVTADQNSTISLAGLEENAKYYYKLRARDIYGNIGESSSVYSFTTTTDTTAPVITFTSAIDITSVTDSSAIISWMTDEAANSQIDYGTSVSYGSVETNANYNIDHSVTLSSLLPSTTYYFKITSVDNSISNNSATDDNSTAGYTFTTLASLDTTPPVILTVSSGTPEYNTATITWTTDESASSLVDFGTDTNYGSTQGNSADSETSHSATLTSLVSDTTYYYRVKSMDASGNIVTDDNSEAGYTFLTISAPDPGDTTAPTISSVSNSSITSTGATITWTTNESSDSTVGFSLNTSFDQEQGSTTATTFHNITLVNLAPETTYYYQVKSRDDGGNLGTDNNSGAGYSFTTLAGGDELVPVISDVTISDITDHTAKVSWNTNENSNSLIDYSRNSGVFTSTTGQYQDNTISHSVNLRGLDPSTAYYLQARSIDTSSNKGIDSNGGTGYTFTTTAGGDETPPEITDVITGTPTYNSVTITWTTNELSNSLIDFGTSTSYGTTQGNSADSVTSHSVSLTGLIPSTTYYYRVKSIDTSGNLVSDDNSGAGWTFTTTAGVDPGDTTAPVISFDSSAGITNVTSNSATISWTTDESSDSIIGYSLDTSFNSEKGSASLTTSHSVVLANLSSGTAYKFQIKSMDNSGNLATENNSGEGYTFTTLAGGDSTAPIISGVSNGTCTDTTCTILWNTDENSSSLVDYGTVQGVYAFTGGNYKDAVTNHTVILSGLTAETIYYYRVRSIDSNDNQALDSGGLSGYSLTTIATEESECPDCPSCGGGGSSCPSIDTNPPTISSVKVSEITTNSVVVKWKTNEEGYSIVEFGLDNSYGGITGLYNNNVKSHSVKINGLESNVAYHYRVASADSFGNLAQSEDFTFKTISFNELTSEEQEEESHELSETTAMEIQIKIEELLTQGIDEEEIRIIIARASEPPVISTEGPVVETLTNNSAKIIWITDRKSNSVIRFKAKEEGIDPEESSSLKQYGNFKELTIDHQVVLASLNSGTSYQYQVQSSDVLGNTSKSDWKEFNTEMTPSIYDVIISEITLNSVVVSWKTNVVTSSKVEYGETINYNDSVEDKDLTKVAKHSIKLNNLKSGTAYHFRVRGMDNEGNSLVSADYSFTTFTLPQIKTYQIEEIAERTIKLNWKTNVETDSTLKYTNLETNITKIQGEDGMSSIHNFTLKGLNPGIEYLLQIQGRDIYGNQAITSEFTATTLADNTIPEIKQIRTETAISSGKSDVVQTIISWKTNEQTTSQILWEEGISRDEEPQNSTSEDENYTTNHITVITSFKPASVYRFRIQGKDRAGNVAQSQDFTILIPEKTKSVIQIIISNFENTFGWAKKLGM